MQSTKEKILFCKRNRWQLNVKQFKGLVVLALCMTFLLSLFGCRNHIADGPGMINTLKWDSFELSRSDSYSQYNFGFIFEASDNGYLLKGECRDENGNIYKSYNGIEISSAQGEKLRSSFKLDDLSDVIPVKNDEADSTAEEAFILDAPTINLILKYYDGSQKEKAITSELSIEIYEQLLPYFMNN